MINSLSKNNEGSSFLSRDQIRLLSMVFAIDNLMALKGLKYIVETSRLMYITIDISYR